MANKPLETSETWQEVVRRKSGVVSRVFASPDGKELLKLLDETFCQRSLFDEDPNKTAYNIGQRDLVVYLQQLKSVGDIQ